MLGQQRRNLLCLPIFYWPLSLVMMRSVRSKDLRAGINMSLYALKIRLRCFDASDGELVSVAGVLSGSTESINSLSVEDYPSVVQVGLHKQAVQHSASRLGMETRYIQELCPTGSVSVTGMGSSLRCHKRDGDLWSDTRDITVEDLGSEERIQPNQGRCSIAFAEFSEPTVGCARAASFQNN